MRTSRPSGKAALVAGAIALTLVVGATSGAIADGLITSDDIQDDTIRSVDVKDESIGSDDLKDDSIRSRDIKVGTIRNSDIRDGAVTWDKSFDAATRELIEGLAQSGAAGPPGPAGPAGSPGSNGSPGSQGPAGEGSLVEWSLFTALSGNTETLNIANPIDTPAPDDDVVPVPLAGYQPVTGPVHLDQGAYMVTLRSLSATLGAWVPRLSSEPGLAGATPGMGVCLSLYLPCETTFPVVVTGAGGADLELYLGDIGDALADLLCSCVDAAAPVASLSVVSLGSDVSAPPSGVPGLGAVVDGLVTQIAGLIDGVGDGSGFKSQKRALLDLQRQAVD